MLLVHNTLEEYLQTDGEEGRDGGRRNGNLNVSESYSSSYFLHELQVQQPTGDCTAIFLRLFDHLGDARRWRGRVVGGFDRQTGSGFV